MKILIVGLFFISGSWAAPKDYFKTLELEKGRESLPSEVQSHARRLLKKYHPDNPESRAIPDAATKLLEVIEAYQVLGDEDSRLEYEQSGYVRAETLKTAADVRPFRRTDFTFREDPTGIRGHNNSELNWYHAIYEEKLETMSPQEAIISTLENESTDYRHNNRFVPRSWVRTVSGSQFQYRMNEFLHEDGILRDFFEGVNYVRQNPEIEGSRHSTANALALSKGPTDEQITRLNRIYSPTQGYVHLGIQSLIHARTKAQFYKYLYEYMAWYYDHDYFYGPYIPEKHEKTAEMLEKEKTGRYKYIMPSSIKSTSRSLLETAMPAIKRLYPEGTTLGQAIKDFIDNHLNLLLPSHLRVAKHLVQILAYIGDASDRAHLEDLKTSKWGHRLLLTKIIDEAQKSIASRCEDQVLLLEMSDPANSP